MRLTRIFQALGSQWVSKTDGLRVPVKLVEKGVCHIFFTEPRIRKS